MPAVPASFIEPLWVQFEALIPARVDTHPLGCHRRRIPDRVVFDKLVARLVLGGSYHRHADDRVSATTLRARRDEWIAAGVFDRLEQAALEAYDTVVGLDLSDLVVDGAGMPISIILTEGQTGDNPQLLPLLEQISVRRDGPGRPVTSRRTRCWPTRPIRTPRPGR